MARPRGAPPTDDRSRTRVPENTDVKRGDIVEIAALERAGRDEVPSPATHRTVRRRLLCAASSTRRRGRRTDPPAAAGHRSRTAAADRDAWDSIRAGFG